MGEGIYLHCTDQILTLSIALFMHFLTSQIPIFYGKETQ